MAPTIFTADVIVIGGGIAGMVAANRAAELGKAVIVLEKGADEKYLCNTRYTGGTFHVCLQDLALGADELYDAIMVETSGTARKDLAHAVARDAIRLVRWMQQEGVRFIRMPGFKHQGFVLAPPASRGMGIDWEGRGGDVMLNTLEANLQKRGGRVLRGIRARALDRTAAGRLTISADSAGIAQDFEAAAVVIADGGYQADRELVGDTLTRFPDKLLQRGAGTGIGDGLRMAKAAGAALTGLDCFYGHLLCRDALKNDRLWPRPNLDALVAGGMVIGADGRRFADEGHGGVFMANAVARLDDPLSATVIFDHATWTGPGANSLTPANPLLVNAGGTLHQSDTIVGLAALIGVPAAVLQETVGTYNTAAEADDLVNLSPPRSSAGSKKKVLPLTAPPYYAVPVCVGITYTMGGIAIDQDSAVLDSAGVPIPGLFAAGGATGGLEGGPTAGYVSGLVKAGVNGLRAAEKIAGFRSDV